MGQTENDMVLGTSSYKNGLRATTFGPRDKGIGYLVGATDDPQIVRTAYIDGPAAEAIGVRARALREAAGTLSGHALGEGRRPGGGPSAAVDPGRHRRRVRPRRGPAVVRGDRRTARRAVAHHLHRHHSREPRRERCKPYGLAPAQVWGTDEDRRAAQPARLPPRRRLHRVDGHPRRSRYAAAGVEPEVTARSRNRLRDRRPRAAGR